MARKVTLMLSAALAVTNVEIGWLFSMILLIGFGVAHAITGPFNDHHLDVCEQGALGAAIMMYMAGMVFTYEKMVRFFAPQSPSDGRNPSHYPHNHHEICSSKSHDRHLR